MKIINILPFTILSTSFVIPDEQVIGQVAIESHRSAESIFDRLPSKHQIADKVEGVLNDVVKCSKNAIDQAIDFSTEAGNDITEKVQEKGFSEFWLDSASNIGARVHHGHHKPNKTLYELIASSKYTTKLAALVNEYPDLVTLLNGTLANYTVFAPIDKAFEKIPEDAPKPSKEFLKSVLLYHVSPEFYPAGKVLVTHTVPTALTVDTVGIGPQRLSTNIGLRGLTVNFYSRIIAIDIVRYSFKSIYGYSLTIPSLETTV